MYGEVCGIRRKKKIRVFLLCCAADEEGFFHSGDVGILTAAGTLKVVDRIKNMFKLAQGEYIAAEHLENVYVCVALPSCLPCQGASSQQWAAMQPPALRLKYQ